MEEGASGVLGLDLEPVSKVPGKAEAWVEQLEKEASAVLEWDLVQPVSKVPGKAEAWVEEWVAGLVVALLVVELLELVSGVLLEAQLLDWVLAVLLVEE